MKHEIKKDLTSVETLFIPVHKDISTFDSPLKALSPELEVALQSPLFDGKPGNELIISTATVKTVILIGLGNSDKVSLESYRVAGGTIGRFLRKHKITSFSLSIPSIIDGLLENVVTNEMISTILMGSYSFDQLKSEKDPFSLDAVSVITNSSEVNSLNDGIILGNAVNDTRDLCLLPGNYLTPSIFAQKAEDMAKKVGLKCTILNEEEMRKESMTSLLSVSNGSSEEARLIVLEHRHKDAQKTVAFVGKGLTFDAGGYSLKPPLNMHEMKMDMSGGAAVFGALQAVAELNLPINVIGVIPSSENLINGHATKPGDIITSKSGKTIEVINTDAEGRLILNDALTYTERFNPDYVIDIATLTGAVLVCLGTFTTGLLGNSAELIEDLKKAGEESYERVWELPLNDDYRDMLKSDVADLVNTPGKNAGTITAGAFLSYFAEKFKWAHLDIAGTGWADGKTSYSPKGSTGVGVRLFIQYLRGLCK